jgi:hypothetical protein
MRARTGVLSLVGSGEEGNHSEPLIICLGSLGRHFSTTTKHLYILAKIQADYIAQTTLLSAYIENYIKNNLMLPVDTMANEYMYIDGRNEHFEMYSDARFRTFDKLTKKKN